MPRMISGQHEVVNTKWPTRSGQHEVVNTKWSTRSGQHEVVNTKWSTRSGQHASQRRGTAPKLPYYRKCLIYLGIYQSIYLATI